MFLYIFKNIIIKIPPYEIYIPFKQYKYIMTKMRCSAFFYFCLE